MDLLAQLALALSLCGSPTVPSTAAAVVEKPERIQAREHMKSINDVTIAIQARDHSRPTDVAKAQGEGHAAGDGDRAQLNRERHALRMEMETAISETTNEWIRERAKAERKRQAAKALL